MLLCRLYVRGMRGIWQPVLTFPPFLRARSTNVTVRIPLQTRASKLQTILFLLYAFFPTPPALTSGFDPLADEKKIFTQEKKQPVQLSCV